ncbi:MAG: hypothetical protein ILA13_01745 [Eubacterium sp.]|nr:hypothetical protein [Eubacterium sp.]
MRSKQSIRLIFLTFGFIVFALGLGARTINQNMNMSLLQQLNIYAWFISGLIVLLLIIEFLLSNHIFKGFKYFVKHWTIKNNLELQMIDAGFGIKRGNIIELPKIVLSFDKDFKSGQLKVRNALKFDKKLDDTVLSSGLGKYIVERHYLSDDNNYYIYDLVDGSVSYRLIFNSSDTFLEYNNKISPYKLFLDGRSMVKLQHTILVGMTGSGKSYSLYSLIMQMLNKSVDYNIHFADPKGSSLAVIGSAVNSEQTYVDMESIIEGLEEFVERMRARKPELKTLLEDKVDADYSDFGMTPNIFIIDEYASFASVLASEDKKTRDKVKALLYEVILQGRQLGFFVFLVMQKSDATLIDTALRDNIPLKIVLGNSEQQTYVTAFGAGVDVPNRHYQTGEGVFTEPVIAPEPKLVQFPFLDFDILLFCKRNARDVITGVPEQSTEKTGKAVDELCSN